MDKNITTRNALLAQSVMKGLSSRNMTGHYAETKEAALKIALDLIPGKATIAWGGSVSVSEIGLKDAVLQGNYRPINRDTAQSPAQRREMELAGFGADCFLCSSNAVTEDGILVNLDGNSNRVAAICYGPQKVIMVVGMNKICKDVDAAVYRVRNTAATCNAQRFPIETPCRKSGACADCKSPDTICCQMLITRYSRHKDRIHVILVNDNLGF